MLKVACKNAFQDTNVKYVFKFIKKISLWGVQDEEITPNSLIYKKGRSDIWAIIRNIIPKDVLAQIEIYE